MHENRLNKLRPGKSVARPEALLRVVLSGILTLIVSFGIIRVIAAQTSDTATPLQNSAAPNNDQSRFIVRVGSNLVVVRVAVHDRQGRPVEKLQKENFRLLDNGKEQTIVQFETENSSFHPISAGVAIPEPLSDATSTEPSPTVAANPSNSVPRLLALYFDDFDMSFADVDYARDAADHYLMKNLRPMDRAAVVTASGAVMVEFTADLKRLHEALFKLTPSSRSQNHDCPQISDYQADEMINREGNYLPGPPLGSKGAAPIPPPATQLAMTEAINRCHMQSMAPDDLLSVVRSAAGAVLDRSRIQAQYALEGLDRLVKYIALMPGQRNVILVSTGFLSTEQQSRTAAIIDHALRSQVTISSIDPKGLAVRLREADASQGYMPKEGDVAMEQHRLDSEREMHATAILEEVADSTGGRYVHNSNDLDAGFRQAAIASEPGYILAFSPKNMKFDGKFHVIKVNLREQPKDLVVNARRGYFAPRTAPDLEAEAKKQMQDVLRSQTEFTGLPVALNTKTTKSATSTELLVWAHLDVGPLHFRKEGAHSINALTFMSAIFSSDGKFVSGQEKQLQLDLEDATLRKLIATGIDVTLRFQLNPGGYTVREVVTDSEEHRLTALSRKIQVP
jgi:VWFA-related protein